MPELPEVQTIVSMLTPHVTGRRIRHVLHIRTDMARPASVDFTSLLKGRTITHLARRAKRIVFTLDDADRFFIHLGMSGQLTLSPALAATKPHTHLIVELATGEQIRLVDPRRFGAIVWLGEADHANIGPEPLTLRPRELAGLLQNTTRAVKIALLDQALIAGIGNIYADESLHLAGIHPTTPARAVSPEQAMALNRAIKQVLRRAIRAGGSSIRDYVDAQGSKGSFQERHQVYDRAGKPCPRCGISIEKIVLGGRSTHFCPRCQVSPRKTNRK